MSPASTTASASVSGTLAVPNSKCRSPRMCKRIVRLDFKAHPSSRVNSVRKPSPPPAFLPFGVLEPSPSRGQVRDHGPHVRVPFRSFYVVHLYEEPRMVSRKFLEDVFAKSAAR